MTNSIEIKSKVEDYLLKNNVGGYSDICLNPFKKGEEDTFEKATDKLHLTKKKIMVTRGGKTFQQTVYVKEGADVGEQITSTIDGLEITQYSEKAIAIGGDTYAKIELMREIKTALGVGAWNGRLRSWIFPSKYKEQVLGLVYSDLKNQGNEEGAEAVKNQKNESLKTGDIVDLSGIKATITEGVSDADGTKYNINLEDGTKLGGVNEKTITTEAETNDKKLAEITSTATAESRLNVDKKIYGIKPVKDIHNYSLKEYLSMHGLDGSDIQKVLDSFLKSKTETSPSTSSGVGGSSSGVSTKGQIEGLSKQQLISKLVYAHYQAVKNNIELGGKVKPGSLYPYTDLMELDVKKKKELTEEHKRKIAEALRKNKAEEEKKTEEAAKKAAQEMIDSLSDKDLEEIKDKFNEIKSGVLGREQTLLAEMVLSLKEAKDKLQELYDRERATDNYDEKIQISRDKDPIKNNITELEYSIRNQKNKVQAIENGGDLSTTTDKVGVEHTNIPNFSRISSENISYSIDNVLTDPKPDYIPDINEKDFASGGYIFDTIRIDKNIYMLATNRYKDTKIIREGYSHKDTGVYDPEQGGYVILTLDQLVLTQDYYTTKKKAELKKDAEDSNQRQIANWDSMSDSKKKWYLDQAHYVHLPAKTKKKFTEAQWEKMEWQERELYHKSVKKYGAKKLKTRFGEHTMAGSFHSMYERFVDPEAMRLDKKRNPLKRGESSYGEVWANSDAWASWASFRQMLDWKINDINIQREEISNQREKAIETSFGMSGTNDTLLESEGILVKRQNGDIINPAEVEQLKLAWENVQGTFGTLKENAKRDNLKLSHTGQKNIFARKAIGVYVPRMKTIGVSAKYGDDSLGWILGHEVAHWMDHTLAAAKGKRHLSDDYESTAGQIAVAFRKNLNVKTDSKYLNATHECFARALEQYHAIETQGVNAEIAKSKYVTTASYVPLDVYENQIKPLIDQFFVENKDLLKAIGFDAYDSIDEIKKAQKLPIGTIRKWSGVEMRKVTETGNKDADWKPVGDKKDGKKDEGGQAGGQVKKVNPKDLGKHAKETSEQALESAVKLANDPKVREAAHIELDRRSKEEHVQEEKDGKEDKKSQSQGKKDEKALQSKGKKDEKVSESEGKDPKTVKEDKKFKVSENKFESGRTVIQIGESNGSRVTGHIEKDGKTFKINSTFVSEGERGKGLAKSMYLKLIDELKKKKIEKIRSDVQVEENAGKIYESLKKDGVDVVQNKDAKLEIEKVGNFWWVPKDENKSPFEINLKEKDKKKSNE